ncbi:hypothetical protein D5086_024932 [Populus alba]|uniref:Uncharacterized protein n=1 Tax=Populus alba TaxID=43335 RepID=A0ACC4B6X4_POPAL
MDVGGGSGTTAKGIAEAFPHMDCTVFDLTHVVSDLQGSMGTGLAMIIHTEFKIAWGQVLTKPWDCLSTWFRNDDRNAFSVAHEKTLWEYAGQDASLNNLFNEAMASDSILASKLVVSKCKGIFDGVNSLVDVGGGLGTMAKGIAEAFPDMNCTVFDLPHVVSDLQGGKNLKYVGGDMFEAVPPADALLLKVN